LILLPLRVRACAKARRRFSAKDDPMPRVKKSIKSRSKEKQKALKRRRVRRKKSARKGTRNK
jgi:hypothetical protein